MTDKTLEELKPAGSQTAEAEAIAPSAPTQDPAAAISALQGEVNNLKEILKSLETQAQPAQQANGQSQKLTSDKVKQIVTNDLKKIAQLVAKGKLSPKQGAVLKNSVLQKAFGSTTLPPKATQNPSAPAVSGDPLNEFEQSNPDFFSSEARTAVKSYLQQGFDSISPDELNKVVELVRMLEEAAILSYQQSAANETAIKETNNEAKKRLASNAMTGSKPNGGSSKTFTREEIGKMSPDEFSQNEAEIMQQLRKGLIK